MHKVLIAPTDRRYQVLLERCIECGLIRIGLADIYNDGDLYMEADTLEQENARGNNLYGWNADAVDYANDGSRAMPSEGYYPSELARERS